MFVGALDDPLPKTSRFPRQQSGAPHRPGRGRYGPISQCAPLNENPSRNEPDAKCRECEQDQSRHGFAARVVLLLCKHVCPVQIHFDLSKALWMAVQHRRIGIFGQKRHGRAIPFGRKLAWFPDSPSCCTEVFG